MGDFPAKRNQGFTTWLLERAETGCELPLAHLAVLADVAASSCPADAASYDRLADVLASHDRGATAMPPPLPKAPPCVLCGSADMPDISLSAAERAVAAWLTTPSPARNAWVHTGNYDAQITATLSYFAEAAAAIRRPR